MGLAAIESAMSMLESEGLSVNAELFAAPGYRQNSKWNQFIQQATVTFRPVARQGGVRDSNDDAIIARTRKLARSPKVTCVALLVSDADFVEVVDEMAKVGKRILVIIPSNKRSCLSAFCLTSAEVLPLVQKPAPQPRVAAILHGHGQGEVQLGHFVEPEIEDRDIAEIWRVLLNAGFELERKHMSRMSSLMPCLAKFWLQQCHSSLTVFPASCALNAMRARIRAGLGPLTARCNQDLAYLLPLGSGSKTKKALELYGTKMAAQVFSGGGPLMLEDSTDIAMRMLLKLGYVDDELNQDLSGALLSFCNRTVNKRFLRKLSLLPQSGEGTATVLAKLRQALLSDQCPGTWSVPPSDDVVRQRLCKDGLLDREEAPQAEVLEAMKEHFRQHGLPAQKNYIGCAGHFLGHLNSGNPTKRDVIKFDLG